MSVFKPDAVWWKPIDPEERYWLAGAFAWCLVMFLVMVSWAAAGKQNPPRETHKAKAAETQKRAADWVMRNQKKDASGRPVYLNGVPVVAVPENEDAYILARTWAWEPVLELKKGRTYRIRLASLDLQHGFSLQPTNLNLTVLPGYEYVMQLTPKDAGEFTVLCNEYCGMGHHQMSGRVIVTE